MRKPLINRAAVGETEFHTNDSELTPSLDKARNGSLLGSETASVSHVADIQEGVYRADKILYHADRIETLRRGSLTVPVTVRASITDLCNHACSFCSFRMEDNLNNECFAQTRRSGRQNNPTRMITARKMKEILGDMADMGVKAVEFTGGGEPTAHPDDINIFEHCLAAGLDAALITNGQRVRASLDTVLSHFTWVRFSIDAARAPTWAAVRRVSSRQFNTVLDNARRLIRYRDRIGSNTLISAGFVVYDRNWHEVYDAVKLFKAIGFDSVRISAVYNSTQKLDHFNGFSAEASALCSMAKADFETNAFHVANNFEARLNDLRFSPEYKRCWYQELAPFLGGDLSLYRCCNTAYTNVGFLGSLQQARFRDLWAAISHDGQFSSFRPDHRCHMCMFTNRNQIASRLIDSACDVVVSNPNPLHENFV